MRTIGTRHGSTTRLTLHKRLAAGASIAILAGTATVLGTSTAAFAVVPAVTSISPTGGPVAGGTTVTIIGTALAGTTAVSFGGTPGTAVTNISATSVSAVSPAGTGAVDVEVTTPGGTSPAVGGDVFTYAAVPAVTSITPSAGVVTGGTTVTITGTGLAGTTGINFGGTAGTTVTNISATSVSAVSPAGTGTVDITVITPGGTSAAVTGDRFTYVAAGIPIVNSISPTTGSAAGGTTVTITGTNLGGTTGVTFGGTPGTTVTNISATSVSAVSPAHAAGAVDVLVTNGTGTSPTGPGDVFTYPPVPTVTSITPSAGVAAGGTTVTITGTGLAGTTVVDFGAAPDTAVTNVNATTVTAHSPVHAVGTVDITVTTPGGTSLANPPGDSFTYVAAGTPIVNSISPTTGPAAGGTTVTITGVNLGGTTGVSFGGTAGTTVTNISATSVSVVSPAGAGAVDVLVTNGTGTSPTGPGDLFTYAASGGGGGGGTGGTTPAAPGRVAGADRFGTAIAASTAEFPTTGSASAVVLARSDIYPDALVGTALAATKHAPLLFTNGGSLTTGTSAEIQRVLTVGGTVYLLGGTAAIPDSVAVAVTAMGYVPLRYSGADRYATALAVANALGNPSTVLLATGINFPDALAAGPAAAHMHGVVLLTNGSSLTPAVTQYLAAHPGTVYAIGGPAVAADPSATALSGADRYATAATVASTLFTAPAHVGVASGTAFPDALSGGAFQAHFGGPIVLTDPHILPTSTSSYLTGAKTTLVTTNIFGGTAALSTTVQTAISTALGL